MRFNMPEPFLFAPPLLAAFLLASLVLAVTPGPAVAYIVARTLAQGKSAGLASVAGVALGNLGNALGASFGLAALFAVSSSAFTALRLAGAAYLIYLGVKALRRAAAHAPLARFDRPMPGRIFREGFWVAPLNPKTAVFFAAFLPQFIDPAASPMQQSLFFGTAFVLIAACTDSLYVLAAERAAPALARLTQGRNLARYAAGTTFIALGLFAALADSRGER